MLKEEYGKSNNFPLDLLLGDCLEKVNHLHFQNEEYCLRLSCFPTEHLKKYIQPSRNQTKVDGHL